MCFGHERFGFPALNAWKCNLECDLEAEPTLAARPIPTVDVTVASAGTSGPAFIARNLKAPRQACCVACRSASLAILSLAIFERPAL